MELSDEAREVVAAELEGRAESTDTAALAWDLRTYYSRGRPILTDAETAPDRNATYKANQHFTDWGAAIEKALTNRLFHRMAGFVMSLERPDPPPPRLGLRGLQSILGGGAGEVGVGGYGPLRSQVRERLDRLQALIEALDSQP